MDFERQKGESERAFLYYLKYQDLSPPRQITDLLSVKIDNRKPNERTLRMWKSKFAWDRRVREFDAEVLRVASEQLIVERVEKLHELLSTETEIIEIVRSKIITGLANLSDDDIDTYKLQSLVRSYDVMRVWIQESVALVDWIQQEDNTDA